MDADGLPLVGPGVDYTKVGPIHQKRTLAFLNHFLIETTSFLNNFATVCDGKLEDMLHRIQRLEASICILENKLASIPGLENAYQETEPEPKPQDTTSGSDTTQSTVSPQALPPNEPVVVQAQPEKEEVKGVPFSQDPRYAKYFKMVNMGVPAGAVKLKMSAEGVDANILDKPDEISPNSHLPVNSQQNDDSDNTDESSEFSD